jgi:hypothetical protein
MNRWRITIEAWPHSTGKGADKDQALAGEREQTFHVVAYDIREAMKLADCISEGMQSNPMVWKAPIKGIIQVPP